MVNPMRKRIGAGSGYGNTLGYDGYGMQSVPGCAPACQPTVLSNAGVAGCGTGTIPGTECSLKILFRRSDSVAAGANATVEALAGRGGAFKPRACYMVGIADNDPSVNARFEIDNITVMGDPQLINYDGVTNVNNRGLTDFFNLQCMPQPVDWTTFGSSAGQGIQFAITNPDPDQDAFLYIALWGDAADASMVGK